MWPRKKNKTLQELVEIKPTASFEEVLQQLNSHYGVSDGQYLRVGKQSGPNLNSFDGLTFENFVSRIGLYYV